MSTIRYEVSDLLSITSGIIAHGCNAVGVMGAGVARAIKDRYPECFEKYVDTLGTIISKTNINDGETVLGNVIWWEATGHCDHVGIEVIIANAIIQDGFYKERNTNYEAVDEAFDHIFEVAAVIGKTEIHIPLIGAGIGGGCWAVIEQIILDRARYANEKPGTVDIVVHCLTEDDIPKWRR